jgi:hypothetical protein
MTATTTAKGHMRSTVAIAFAFVVFAPTLSAAPQRYVRAEENANHDLVVITSAGERIVVPKSDRSVEAAADGQVGFRDIAIASDGSAVGWTALYNNCCTSYPIPLLVEVYSAGQRHTFSPAIVPWAWCFVDGTQQVASASTTTHGPQHAVIELWDVSTGVRRDEFLWMEDESYPQAPAWVKAVQSAAVATHQCSTK